MSNSFAMRIMASLKSLGNEVTAVSRKHFDAWDKQRQQEYLKKYPRSKFAQEQNPQSKPTTAPQKTADADVNSLKKQWMELTQGPYSAENQKKADALAVQIKQMVQQQAPAKPASVPAPAPAKPAPVKVAPKPAPEKKEPAPKVAPQQTPDQPKKAAKGKAAHDAATVQVSDAERQALNDYTGSMYIEVNKALRSGKPIPKSDQKEVKLIDQAFSRASTTEDIQVYRGVGPTDMDKFANLKPGDSYTDDAYLSTSTNLSTADNFSRGDTPTILNIQVPKGSKAISVDSLSQFKKGGHMVRSEEEILLNRGGKYKVVSIKPARRGSPRVITVEYQNA